MQQSLDALFDAAFKGGLVDIKFFVRRGGSVDADKLKDEATLFQAAISEGRTQQVEAVD